jgi:leader peptidase (prepilin peptidase)/N-methyltransferase
MTAIVTVIFALLGLEIGSFLNLCIDRLPRGKSIVRPGSHCDNCRQSLRTADLVPLFSYIWLRGRCRYCGASISVRLPIVELATGAIFALLAWYYFHLDRFSVEFAFAVLCAGLFVVIFVIDLEQGLVLNSVVLFGVALAFVFSFFRTGVEDFWPKTGPGIILSALMGGAVGFAIMLLPYLISRGGMGAGDVKLAGLIGMVVGFPQVFVALLVGIIIGGLVAVFLLVSRLRKRREAIPFGPFLAVGAIVALVWGEQIIHWYRTTLTGLG